LKNRTYVVRTAAKAARKRRKTLKLNMDRLLQIGKDQKNKHKLTNSVEKPFTKIRAMCTAYQLAQVMERWCRPA